MGNEQNLEKLRYTSLIAQLVSDVRPIDDLSRVWPAKPEKGDVQQSQICQIVDAATGQSATAPGFFYQLIVRLHKYSMGQADYRFSVHWQRGLVLEDDYNGRALLEHVGNDVCITIRAPYPERFLSVLTQEVRWLVHSFWEGLRCNIMVPCINPCGREKPGTALFDVGDLILHKKKEHYQYLCGVCKSWLPVESLLGNAPEARHQPIEDSIAELKGKISEVLSEISGKITDSFESLNAGHQRILSRIDDAFDRVLHSIADEAKDGPRLYSFEPVDPSFLDKPQWMSVKFRMMLWCEHSRLPLIALNFEGDTSGIYELEIPRKWLEMACPFLKVLTGTLGLVVPLAFSTMKLTMNDVLYKEIEKHMELGQKSLDALQKSLDKTKAGKQRDTGHKTGLAHEAANGELRQLQVWLKEKDPSFGGLVRVLDKQQKFLWVHPKFVAEY